MVFRSVITAACLALSIPAASAQAIRVGYWASGASAAIGIVLEKGKFLEAEGLKPEWITVTKLAEVNRALISGSIDIAASGGTVPSLRLGAEHVPAKIIMANMIADANFVVPEASPIHTLAELKGKKIGSTPPGSTMHALVGTILQQSYGLGPDDIAQIPSGEAQLLTFMQRGEIDAAVMRTITLKTLGSAIHVRILSTVPEEWEKLIHAQSPPVLGVAVVSDDYEGKHPDAVVRYLVANIKAVRWGAAHPDEVATMLAHALQMADADAQALAKTWSATYFTSFDAADITSLLKMADIFKADGNFPGEVGHELFLTAPFQQAKAIADAAR